MKRKKNLLNASSLVADEAVFCFLQKDDEIPLPVLSHFYHDPEDAELKEVVQVVLIKEGQVAKKKGK